MKSFAPICLFVYNRLDHTRTTVEHLLKNSEASSSELYVFSDGPRNKSDLEPVKALRSYLKTISGFQSVEIIERSENLGLAKSIIDGVSTIVQKHGRVIVVEDDLVTSPYFLKFMNDGLDVYQDEPSVASIHGYIYPIEDLPATFFLRGADCWGWATWKDRWDKFEPDGKKLYEELKKAKLLHEFDLDGSYGFVKMLQDQINGKNNSWAIRWHASAFLKGMYTLYPGKSLVFNIGFDNSGTHCDVTDVFDVNLNMNPVSLIKNRVIVDQKVRKTIVNYLKHSNQGRLYRIISAIKANFKSLFSR